MRLLLLVWIAVVGVVFFLFFAVLRWALGVLFARDLETRLADPPPAPEPAPAPPRRQTTVRVRQAPFQEKRIELSGPPCPARVRYWARDRKKRRDLVEYTEFAAELPNAPRRLRVATAGWQAGQGDFGAEFRTGDAVFDEVYQITTTFPGWAEAFLDAEVRDCIHRLDTMHAGPFLLDVRGTALVVRVTGSLESVTDLDPFIRGCYRLCERALETPGIEAGAVESAGSCPLCGADARDPMITCAKCRTPHHKDCWDYNDGCAIFACGARTHSG